MAHTPKTDTPKNEHSLPDGWQWVKLKDVCEQDRKTVDPKSNLANRLIYLSLEHIESDSGRILRKPNKPIEDEGKSNTFAFDSRHVLYGKLRPYLNKVALPDFEGRCTTEIIPILPTNIDKEFLAWVLRRKETVETAMREKTGSRMPRANMVDLFSLEIPLPPLEEQRRIAKRLNEQMAAVESARKAAEEQLELSNRLINSYLKQSLSGSLRNLQLKDGFVEVKKGIGQTWADYPVLGTTRNGVAPAKEKVGKQPERYKLVEPGTIFYNPMRINIGSIGMLDAGDEPGITSPDYVIMNSVKGVIHPRWFYYWLRSPFGEAFIKTVARGAVRERMMFTRLAPAYLDVPSYEIQSDIAEKLLGIKQLRASIESQLVEINRLPASLLREGFAGRV